MNLTYKLNMFVDYEQSLLFINKIITTIQLEGFHRVEYFYSHLAAVKPKCNIILKIYQTYKLLI